MPGYYQTERQAILHIRGILRQMKTKEVDFKVEPLSMQVFELFPCSRKMLRSTIEREAQALGASFFERTGEWIWPSPGPQPVRPPPTPLHDPTPV